MVEQTQYLECADVETSSLSYASRFAGETGAWLLERQNRILKHFVHLYSPNTLLDVGGGHGQIAQALADSAIRIKVLGSSVRCEDRLKELKTNNSEFVVGPLENLPFNERAFDVATCFRFLSHTDHWQQVISELCRVSARAVIVDYPTLLSFNLLTPLLFKVKKRFEGNTRPYTIFTHTQVVDAFDKCGFRLVGTCGQFFFPMVLHRMLKNTTFSDIFEFLPRVTGLTNVFGTPAISCFERNK